MADFTDSKDGLGSVFPDRAIDGHEWSRVEPLITPQQLRRRFLLGIPLFSYIVNPVTGERDEIQDEDLRDFIDRSIADTELETGLTIFPTQYDEKHPFDMNFWRDFGYLKVEHRPVASVEKVAFTPANGSDIFVVNNDWLEAANFHKGQINLIPMVPAVSATFVGSAGGASGAAYLTFMGGMSWVPALVRVTYTAGFPEGLMPKIINELIGINAAMEVLTLLAATNRASSYSQSIDGISQRNHYSWSSGISTENRLS